MKRPDYCWNFLGDLAEIYFSMNRILRNKYRWSPSEIDCLPIDRMIRIVNETIEDNKKDNVNDDIEDF